MRKTTEIQPTEFVGPAKPDQHCNYCGKTLVPGEQVVYAGERFNYYRHPHCARNPARRKYKPGEKRAPRGRKPGYRLNTPSKDWELLRADLCTVASLQHGKSRLSIAKHCGVSSTTIYRWLAGEDLPPAHACEQMRFWLVQQLV